MFSNGLNSLQKIKAEDILLYLYSLLNVWQNGIQSPYYETQRMHYETQRMHQQITEESKTIHSEAACCTSANSSSYNISYMPKVPSLRWFNGIHFIYISCCFKHRIQDCSRNLHSYLESSEAISFSKANYRFVVSACSRLWKQEEF